MCKISLNKILKRPNLLIVSTLNEVVKQEIINRNNNKQF